MTQAGHGSAEVRVLTQAGLSSRQWRAQPRVSQRFALARRARSEYFCKYNA